MNDLVILHLSDLHIDSTGKSYSKLHRALLEDIKDQIRFVPDNRLVIAVTGDTINMGDENALSNAKMFFQKLKEVTEAKLKAIYIIPGNHDKKRTPSNSILVPAYRGLVNDSNTKLFDATFKNTLWQFQKETYVESGYAQLIDYIYHDLFQMHEIGSLAQNTYGVHVLEIEHKKYCFVLLNTAWSCVDNLDTRKLILGNFQLDDIVQQFQDMTNNSDNEPINMTFVMGHHPIECFFGAEQDALFSRMISYTDLCANAYLCGHTHDRNVINWSNSRHTIHTLMTGFGWPEKATDRVHDHYYSIYSFNINLNSMDIYVRKTNDGSKFIPDLSIYTGPDNHDCDKLVRPIILEEAQGAIVLSSANNVPSKTLYASTGFLHYGKLFQDNMHDISLDTGVIIESYKYDLYENLLPYDDADNTDAAEIDYLVLEYMNDPESISRMSRTQRNLIKNVMRQNTDRICENFQAFVQRLCQKIHEGLVDNVSEGQIVRFHFRYLADKINSTYSTLCSSFSTTDISDEHANHPSDIKYGDLLEAAFMNKSSGCLIYSINERVCTNKLKDKWANFITVIPKFEKNRYSTKGKKAAKSFPLLTFGVTINDPEHEALLQCMDFYGMDQYISNFLERYLNVFMLDVDDFINWLKIDEKLEEK